MYQKPEFSRAVRLVADIEQTIVNKIPRLPFVPAPQGLTHAEAERFAFQLVEIAELAAQRVFDVNFEQIVSRLVNSCTDEEDAA